MTTNFVLVSMSMLMLLTGRAAIHWDYGLNGPDVWPELFPQCGGERQSPVNIRTSCTTRETFESLVLSSSHWRSLNYRLRNNGHTVLGELPTEQLYFSGINLQGIFVFQNFHLHWGANHRSGSEHQINGEKYSGEAHFVYKNEMSNESAVLSFLMRSSSRSNSTRRKKREGEENLWHQYFDQSQDLVHENDSKIVSFQLGSLMGDNLKDFWRYEGSLTTPPCDETVQWTIFRKEILLEDYDFQTFRDDLFFESYRGPQPLRRRAIRRSFEVDIPSSDPEQQCCFNRSSTLQWTFQTYFTVVVTVVVLLSINFF